MAVSVPKRSGGGHCCELQLSKGENKERSSVLSLLVVVCLEASTCQDQSSTLQF